jgi:uncharacterized protein YndB with AHSA1/START domain
MKISIETLVNAPVAKVWRAYTAPEDIQKWNAPSADWHTATATSDLKEGGAFSYRMEAKDGSSGFDFEGTYTKVVPNERLEYSFGDRYCEIEFLPGSDGVTVRVTFDPESDNPVDFQRDGWQAILDNFGKYVEAAT